MTTYGADLTGGPGFARLLHAEWTKFRTVRGWAITIVAGVLATIGLGVVSNGSCSASGPVSNSASGSASGPASGPVSGPVSGGGGCPAPPLGPGGEAVRDGFYFVRQPLAGNGTITVQMTALTGVYMPAPSGARASSPRPGLQQWSKAGIIITADTTQGSAYAAMIVTGGHGVRMQWDYVHDVPGLPGLVSVASPRWLRLVRDGDTISGYDSADGTRWTLVGTATLAGLPATAQAGLFAASPDYVVTRTSGIGGSSGSVTPSQATGTFGHVGLSWHGTGWSGQDVGGSGSPAAGMAAGFRHRDGSVVVTGSGDIAPLTANTDTGGGVGVKGALAGTFAGLIAVIVIAAMFITTEYRRGLIRITFMAEPRRLRMLAAKAVVLAAIGFAAGVVAISIGMPLGISRLKAGGLPFLAVPVSTEIRIVTGTGLMLAMAAVLAVALGTAVRRSAVAAASVIAAVFVPYLLADVPGLLPLGAQQWLLRVTPAAAFSVQQAYPAYAQVATAYRPVDGYYPLAPWAGFAVLCAWAGAALMLAGWLLRRRDA